MMISEKKLSSEETRYQKAKSERNKEYEQQVAEIRADIKLQEQKTDAVLQQLQRQELDELQGRGADARMVEECKASIRATDEELKYIENHRRLVFDYQRDKEELFNHEEELNAQRKQIVDKLQQLDDKYNQRKKKDNENLELNSRLQEVVLRRTKADAELSKVNDDKRKKTIIRRNTISKGKV